MINFRRLLLLFLIMGVFVAPLSALEKTLQMTEVPSEFEQDVEESSQEVVAVKQKQSFSKDIFLVSSGVLCLFSAYQLYPQLIHAYEQFKRSKGVRKIVYKPTRKVHTFSTLAEDTKVAQEPVKVAILKAGAELAAYSLSTAAFIGLGLVSLARGLHLVE
ncbi:hypothetical protein H0X48_05630 [Candidatus Dependentiae bacterium]|nr:hypothetical protein [Candidatus Dependentiae bacterium]